MSDQMKISNELIVGSQPDGNEISALAKDGFKTVINFRTEGEEQQSLSPDAERELVEAAGMTYLHVPVSPTTLPSACHAVVPSASTISLPTICWGWSRTCC